MSNVVESPLGRLIMAGTLRLTRPVEEGQARNFGSYAIAYLVAGSGHYWDARGARRPVSAGNLIIVLPDVPHRYGPREGESWEEIYLVFDGALFDLLRKSGLLDADRLVLRLDPVEYWFRQIATVAEFGSGAAASQPHRIIARLHALLADMISAQEVAESPRWVKEICRELAIPDRKPEWSQLARRAHLSPDAFRKKFARMTGLPPARYRTARLIEHASALLHDTDLPQKEIAHLLGFADEFHFSKVFKRHLGFPPSAFRLRVRGVR